MCPFMGGTDCLGKSCACAKYVPRNDEENCEEVHHWYCGLSNKNVPLDADEQDLTILQGNRIEVSSGGTYVI